MEHTDRPYQAAYNNLTVPTHSPGGEKDIKTMGNTDSPQPVTSGAIVAKLRTHFEKDGKGQYVVATEVNEGTGGAMGRRADLLAMGCWPSSGYVLTGFEIKVSRADWLRELADTTKADAVGKFCDYWYVAAPKGLVKIEELPTGWGLMEATEQGVRTAQRAVKRVTAEYTPAFFASMLRRVSQGGLCAEEKLSEYRRGYDWAKDQAQAALDREKKATEENRAMWAKLHETVEEFRKETGIPVASGRAAWGSMRLPTSAAVKFVMDGGLESQNAELERLTQIARQIIASIEGANKP